MSTRQKKTKKVQGWWWGGERAISHWVWGWGAAAAACIPGSACATFLNRVFTLYPAFALVSINITPNSLAFFSPSSVETCLDKRGAFLRKRVNPRRNIQRKKNPKKNLLSLRSVLFPTKTMITSLPLSARTSSIHLNTAENELRPAHEVDTLSALLTMSVISLHTKKQDPLVIS